MRRLIVNAEDFGRTSGINRGVLEAHARGIVTSASLMVRWPAAAEAAEMARDHPGLGVGLHVELTEWTQARGGWRHVYDVVPLDDPRAVAAEIARQLDGFRRLVGRDPTHVDGHQAVHRNAAVAPILVELAGELGVPVPHHTPAIHVEGRFFGRTSAGDPHPEGIREQSLVDLLDHLRGEVTELRCHPGTMDGAAGGGEGAADGWDGGGYTAERSAELATLCAPRVREALTRLGIRLCHFGDLRDVPPSADGVEALDRIHALRSGDALALGDLALRYLELGEPARALRAAEDLLRLDGSDERGVLVAATALWRQGARREARDFLDEKLRSDAPAAVAAAMRFHLDVGDPAAARRLARGRERLVPPALLLRLGSELDRRGSLSAARAAFEAAADLDPAAEAAARAAARLASQERVLRGRWEVPEIPVGEPCEAVPGRVLHLVAHSLPHRQDGYAVRTQYAALAQEAAGLDPRVVTQLGFPWSYGAAESAVEEEHEGVRYYRLLAPDGLPLALDEWLSRNLLELAGLVRRLRPAVLHAASDYQNALLAIELGRAFGLPVVYEVRGFWEETRLLSQGPGARARQSYRWHRERERACMAGADRVVTLSERMAEAIVARGVPRDRIEVVPNAVDTDVFAPVERDAALAERLGLDPAEVILGTVSSLHPYEGIDVLLRAVRELRARALPVRGLVVGDGRERPALERRAADLGLSGAVIFTGQVPHTAVPRYYGLVDVVVVPRTVERVSRLVTPLKPFEAMAMERAVLVSDVPGLREIAVEGENALVFRAGDPRDLARVAEPLIRSREEREALGRRARAWVCANRTWRRNGLRYLELYRSLGAA